MNYLDTYSAVTEWRGLEVLNYSIGDSIPAGSLIRIATDYRDGTTSKEKFEALFACEDISNCEGLVLGVYQSNDDEEEVWENAYAATIPRIVDNADQFPKMKHLFVGDFDAEIHLDISMATGGSVGELLNTFPGLENLHMRSSDPLLFSSVRHACLRTLYIEGSGISDVFVNSLSQCVFPELTELVLCPGGDDYGGMGNNIQPLISFIKTNPFPSLKKLGICSSSAIDKVIEHLAGSECLSQLESLDLSLGALSDKGADILLTDASFQNLKSLDLFHNYISEEKRNQFKSVFPNTEVNTDIGRAEPGDDWRYVGISE